MNTLRICPACRAPLPPDAPAGLCPACLLQSGALLTTGGAQASTAGATPRPHPDADFGSYRIIRLLGQGGMGEVYEAEQLATGRRVALKVMNQALATDQDRKRFLREGRLAASVNHPNVVYVHGSEEISDAPVIAMELVHGGTLKDRLKHGGPLPVAEAAAAALQMIAGLEAAHAAGVLHRDIKPANCFIAADGTVKVGDFGLSVSTIARGESLLTATGSVLGTPAYASPEQLRGEELDVTSDIYSVGATLYHLLTGRTPFPATDFVKLITEVLDKQPEAPAAVRKNIPPALSKLLLRCLAKERKARFQSYGELRDALLPFAAAEAVPANPALRFLAGILDNVIAYAPCLLFLIYWSLDPLDAFVRDRTARAALVFALLYSWQFIYFAVAEGLWGAALGKLICGLRVVGRDRQAPGVLRALWRATVFTIPAVVPSFVLMAMMTQDQIRAVLRRDDVLITDWLWIPLLAGLFITMRRRNGYAAVHDFLSGTRVIVHPRTQPRPGLAELLPSAPAPLQAVAPAAAATLGPYEVQGLLWQRSGEELRLGFDPALRRKVWLHLRPSDPAPVPIVRRDLSRAARLRWLSSGHTESQQWDAYEAVEGTPLLALSNYPREWNAVRFWLLDLAEELGAALDAPETAPVLALDRVWISSQGRAVLLDFPCPGLSHSTESSAPAVLDGVPAMQQFLRAVVWAVPMKPTPLHTRSFLASLAAGTFEKAEFVIGNLHSLIAKPAVITPSRRAVSLALGPAIFLCLGLVGAGMISFERVHKDRWWATTHPGLPSLNTVGHAYLTALDNVEVDPERSELVRAYLVTHYAAVLTNETFWAMPEVRSWFSGSERRQLRKAITAGPPPETQLVAQAEQEIAELLAVTETQMRAVAVWILLGMLILGVTFLCMVELAGAAIFGQSPLLRLFGIAIVDRDGQPAARWRLLARWAVAWLPGAGLTFLAAGTGAFLIVLVGWPGEFSAVGPEVLARLRWTAAVAIPVLAGLLLAAGAYAVLRPERSLPDLIAGTSLVPR